MDTAVEKNSWRNNNLKRVELVGDDLPRPMPITARRGFGADRTRDAVSEFNPGAFLAFHPRRHFTISPFPLRCVQRTPGPQAYTVGPSTPF